jgi:2-polyprenyl-6-methoxyphenol hydroxylase-like FAD-dependent oxidoreductase
MLSHGTFSFMFHRAELIQTIHEGLSEENQARIHTNKALENIEETDDGVIVTCADGSTYKGSIVLGADGVHSQTRRLMRELSLRKSPDAEVNDVVPFQHSYKTMWCTFPRRWEYAPGDVSSILLLLRISDFIILERSRMQTSSFIHR